MLRVLLRAKRIAARLLANSRSRSSVAGVFASRAELRILAALATNGGGRAMFVGANRDL